MLFPLKDINPTRHFPVVTLLLVAANVAAFLYQMGTGLQASILEWGLVPRALFGGGEVVEYLPDYGPVQYGARPWMDLLASMFMHGGFLHLAGNMLYLWIFGNNVEDTLGHTRYLVFYLLSGVAAALAQTVVGPSSSVPMVGASGAISGVLGAYLLLFPGAHVTTLIILGFFFRVVQVPAMVVLGFWIVLQVLNGLGSFGASGGVAFFAHIGGFVAGMGLLYVLRPRARSRTA